MGVMLTATMRTLSDTSLILLSLLISLAHSTPDVTQEFCQNEIFEAKCGADEVIMVTSAMYGRMKRESICINQDYGYVGQCKENVLREADNLCSGRRECRIPIPNSIFDSAILSQADRCPKDLKSYLEITYRCYKVLSGSGYQCPGQGSNYLILPPTSGVIPSVLTEEHNLGSADCPWLIKGQKGQLINITLVDFSVSKDRTDTCHAYASLREREPTTTNTICSGTSREKQEYLSKTNAVEIRILTSQDSTRRRYFLLKYEVVGCPDLSAPAHGWVERTSGTARVGCNEDKDKIWSLVCKDNAWHGKPGNCSTEAAAVGQVPWGGTTLPFGISIVIIVGIALAIGIVILIVGLIVLKWYMQRRRQAAEKHASYSGENTYQSSKYIPQPPPPPQSPKDNDSLYATENEYAYISDFPLPPQANQSAAPYHSNKRSSQGHPSSYPGYGSAVGTKYSTFNMKNTSAHGTNPEVARYETGIAHAQNGDGYDPPKYFELDPNAARVGDGGSGFFLPSENGHVTAKSYQNEASSHVVPYPNKSLPHDYNPAMYDHLEKDYNENKNHKSV